MGQRDIRRLLIIGAVAVTRWAARKGELYNSERPHTAVDKRMQDSTYFVQEAIRKAAWTQAR